MKIMFRVDAYRKMGIGHLMRCLTLANELRKNDSDITFVISYSNEYLISLIQSYGFQIESFELSNAEATISNSLEIDYDFWNKILWKEDSEKTLKIARKIKPKLIVVDHYGLDAKWHHELRSATKKIMVIDDLANRNLDCDLMLNQTFGISNLAYKDLVSAECKLLVGAKYALIRRDFAQLRHAATIKRQKKSEVSRILISLGGSSHIDLICQILKNLADIKWPFKPIVDIVLTNNEQNIDSLREVIKKTDLKINLMNDVDNMAKLMLEADFAIGASGSTTWERCCLGLPSVVFGLAENQMDILKNLDSFGAIISMGKDTEFDNSFFCKKVMKIISRSSYSESLISKSFSICDGLGARRVYLALNPFKAKDGNHIHLREALLDDSEMLLKWQHIKEVRQYARNPSTPSLNEHESWMHKKIKESTSYFWIIMHNDEPSGVIRLDNIEGFQYEVSIFVIPQKFGLGIAKSSIYSIQYLFEGVANFSATILPENKASIKLFMSTGFIFDNERQLYIW
jgi:UDP-2,4-diacetamido-2,4,6-trideoxy-beta-L-altropyranose hydrolase